MDLGIYSSSTNISTTVSTGTIIIIHLQSVPNMITWGQGSGDPVQLSTASNFGSGLVACSVSRSGRFGTQIIVTPNASLSSGTQYYLRVVHDPGNFIMGATEGLTYMSVTSGSAVPVQFGNFQTAS